MSSAPQDDSATVVFATPGDSRLVEHEDEARGGVLHCPVGVVHAMARVVVTLVGQAEVLPRLGALEVVEHAKGVGIELVRLVGRL